jgi:hypothetical protein
MERDIVIMYVGIEVSKKSAPSIVRIKLLFNYGSLLIFSVLMKLCATR